MLPALGGVIPAQQSVSRKMEELIMETSPETRKQPANKTLIAIIILIAVVIIAAVAVITTLNRQKPEEDAGLTIQYASNATVMLDQDSIQAAMDEAMKNAEDGNIGLYYKNDAYSSDGVNFDCFIGNSSANIHDMFITIFADVDMTDQIYLSGLVPPGSGFEEITLEHELESGNHRVYVALTQVDTDEETGEQVLLNQVVYTMDFHVTA